MIKSTFRKYWNHTPLAMPEFAGTRVMMMPVRLGSLDGIPEQYHGLINQLYGMIEGRFIGEIGYLTIDEQILKKGEFLRRPKKHVDGYYNGRCGAWGGGGGWGSVGNGMLVISSTPNCKAWLGNYDGEPDNEGGCEHIKLNDSFEIFEANQVYWVDGACIHETLPMEGDSPRQFLRLSMPNNGAWFEGYTENPTGIMPTGEILPQQKREDFMKYKEQKNETI